MNVAYASDLHLEFNKCNLQSDEADVLILAGDVGVASIPAKHYLPFFQLCADRFKRVIYILGNHEHYGFVFKETADFLKNKLAHLSNVTLLDNEIVSVDGIQFAGTTLWSDIKVTEEFDVGRFMQDYCYIRTDSVWNKRITVSDLREIYEKNISWLKSVISDTDVVITHHLPSYQSVADIYKSSEVNSGFASNLDNLIWDNQHVQLWIHAHTHVAFEYDIGKVHISCNPRGYYGSEHRSLDFKTKVRTILHA
jgi:hypothetical protein